MSRKLGLKRFAYQSENVIEKISQTLLRVIQMKNVSLKNICCVL
jgi:hypothetical protein